MRTSQVKCLLYDRTIPFNLYSVWPTFIFSYNFITFISSGENSVTTNFECATEVKIGSLVGVSQSGRFNFPGWVWIAETNCGQGFSSHFCNAYLVKKFTKIELFRTASFWYVKDIHFIWSKLAKGLLLKNLTKASIAISCQKNGHCCLK